MVVRGLCYPTPIKGYKMRKKIVKRLSPYRGDRKYDRAYLHIKMLEFLKVQNFPFLFKIGR